MSRPADNRAHLERLFDGVWNGEDPGVADELVGPEYYIHDRDLAGELRGPELYRALASGTRDVFPDASFTIQDAFGADDRVALRWTMTGTHRGPMLGVEATGESVELSAIEIDRFESGELVETWTQSDMLGLLAQLGADPTA